MPLDVPRKTTKSKRMKHFGRISSTTDTESQLPYSRVDEMESVLPPVMRGRLYKLFSQIEKEFEALYTENLSLKEKIESLSEQLGKESHVSLNESRSDMPDLEPPAGKSKAKRESITASQLSQKIKSTYKLKAFKTPNVTCNLVTEYHGHRDGVWEVSCAKHAHHGLPLIVTASADHTARIWDIQGSVCVLKYIGHKGSVNSARFHPMQDLVVTASGDYSAHVWSATVSPVSGELNKCQSSEEEVEFGEDELGEGLDSASAAVQKSPKIELQGHIGVVIAADWLAGGEQVITASWDRTANVYDVHTGELVTQLVGHDQELTNTCTHPSQRLVVTSSKDMTFRLWDFREAIHSVSVSQGHTEAVTSAAFAGGEKVVSGSDDRTVKVWDLRNMRSPLTTIRLDSPVNRLAVSNQHTIAIPHDNRQIRLYDLNGVRLARLRRSNRQGHRRMVCSVAWADDIPGLQCNLFSCGFDRVVIGWKFSFPCKEDAKPGNLKVN